MSATYIVGVAAMWDTLEELNQTVTRCVQCPRLVEWRERVAHDKRAAYAGEKYWGRPVPSFGDPRARILVVGLAPAGHGGNRTGRIFTGDRSGDWLFASLHRAGFASQPASTRRDDGMTLRNVYVTAAVRCAPPANKPRPDERDNCLPYLVAELRLLTRLRVVVALGGFAWDATLRAQAALTSEPVRPKPRFGHGRQAGLGPITLLGCFHPSQQNTFTGRLTEDMIDSVWARARSLAGGAGRT